MNDVGDAKRRTYPSHHWGPLADDPWMEIASPAAGDASRSAALRVWLADGGSAEDFEALCKPTKILL